MWIEQLLNDVLDHGCKRYAVRGPYACINNNNRTACMQITCNMYLGIL